MKITWPPSTAQGEPRTTEKVLNIVNDLENLAPDERKGITGRSLFLDIPSFVFVRDIPAENLHSMCLGVIKRLTELTFSVGEVRPRITKRKLSKPLLFNKLMCSIKTPGEFPRRARDLDFSVLKATEFRNLCIFYFPLVLECIEPEEGETKLWLYLAYMIRSSVIPSDEYRYVDLDDVNDYCTKFYNLYHKMFGDFNCTYNTHVVCSHFVEIRAHGPLTLTSAFAFESFYGEMRHAFVPSTVSPLKQILKNIMLKRYLTPHSCTTPITYSDHTTSLENNTLIYCWEYNQHNVYVIQEIIDQDNFLCLKLNVSPAEFEDLPELEWHKVGVYEKGELETEPIVIEKSKISGKVVEVMNYLMTCPINILREK